MDIIKVVIYVQLLNLVTRLSDLKRVIVPAMNVILISVIRQVVFFWIWRLLFYFVWLSW